MPRIELPKDAKRPLVACTQAELTRLREAWKGTGPAHDVVAKVVAAADALLGKPVEFPPRGGQHNQWYQCDRCQMGLKTIDDTHHECPACKKVYSGEPYDDVIFGRKHGQNVRSAATAAWAHAVTGERKYAERAASVLLGYGERYLKYPYHTNDPRKNTGNSGGHLAEQTLNEAYDVAKFIAPAFDLICDSGVLTEQDRAAVRDGLILPMLKNIERNKAGKSNWQTWHNAAFVAGGAAIGDAAWVRKAIEDPANGFVFQMGVSVSPEGMWYENSWGYHFYTLDAMVAIAEGARRVGADLWGHPSFKAMFTLPAQYAMADGSLPRFGDDTNSSARGSPALMEPAWHAYRDPALLAVLPEKPVWETILLGRDTAARAEAASPSSGAFPGAGHAILRTKGDAGLTAALTFGPYGGFHGHFDKLSFVFFGWGKELGVDPGRAKSQAYRLPIHGNWYKATIGHNAVLVDGKSQKPAAGKLDSFAANESFAAAVASCGAAYPGVAHRRALVLTPAYLLVLDRLASGKDARFDWLYHNRGTKIECEAAAKDGGPAKEQCPGFEYVTDAKTGSADGTIRARIAGEAVSAHVTVAGEPRTEVAAGTGVGESVQDRVPLVMVSRKGKGARFAAVIEPVAKDRKPEVSDVSVEEKDDAVTVTVVRGGAKDVFAIGRDGQWRVESDGKTVLSGK